MVKIAVRAMDAMQEFVKEKTDHDVDNFMMSGESKRGWTTWLTGAVDDRVIAIAPAILSCLNLHENFHHYWKSLGGWSFAMFDYWSHGIMGLIDEPEMLAMDQIIDPYAYLEYLTMPKLIVSSASDEFFMPDDYDYFYKDLLGEKRILMMENSGHGHGPRVDDFWSMLSTFYLSVLTNHPLPTTDWTREYTATGGSLILLSSVVPTTIKVWAAKSIAPNRRDWRFAKLGENFQPEPSGVVWLESTPEDLGSGYYRAQFDNPDEGYLAFFISMSYPGPEGRTYHFTTETAIIPDNFPHADCQGIGCTGMLL
jgi:PhoPQ-activated pathogenicity-related protein